jgi:serine/threonine protein kinase
VQSDCVSLMYLIVGRTALRVLLDTADALRYLHEELHVCHGDVYAHNVLVNEVGHAVLCDYGASFVYSAQQQDVWEHMEVGHSPGADV